MDKTDSIYTIEDLVSGKRITTHIHNRRPFIYDPISTNPLIGSHKCNSHGNEPVFTCKQTDSAKAIESGTSVREVLDKMIA